MKTHEYISTLFQIIGESVAKKYLYSKEICSRQAIYDVLSNRRKVTLEQAILIVVGLITYINDMSIIDQKQERERIILELQVAFGQDMGVLEVAFHLDYLEWCFSCDTLKELQANPKNKVITHDIVNNRLFSRPEKLSL